MRAVRVLMLSALLVVAGCAPSSEGGLPFGVYGSSVPQLNREGKIYDDQVLVFWKFTLPCKDGVQWFRGEFFSLSQFENIGMIQDNVSCGKPWRK